MRAGDALIYELGDTGPQRVEYDDVGAVGLWRRFLDDPDSLLEILYSDDD